MFSIKFGARLLCLFMLAECLAYWEHNCLQKTITYLQIHRYSTIVYMRDYIEMSRVNEKLAQFSILLSVFFPCSQLYWTDTDTFSHHN